MGQQQHQRSGHLRRRRCRSSRGPPFPVGEPRASHHPDDDPNSKRAPTTTARPLDQPQVAAAPSYLFEPTLLTPQQAPIIAQRAPLPCTASINTRPARLAEHFGFLIPAPASCAVSSCAVLRVLACCEEHAVISFLYGWLQHVQVPGKN